MQLDPSWDAILRKRLRAYSTFEGERRQRFLTYLQQFLGEKQFVAQAQMVIDDDVRVTIAATAVRVVLDIGIDHLRDIRAIVVYPHSVPVGAELAAGAVVSHGAIVDVHLGWAQVLHSLEHPRDGYDVLVHELAHVLDHHAGEFDGAPRLHPSQDYELWAHVLHRHFLDHWFHEPEVGSVLRAYGRIDAVEFFAVATEAFFERPEALAKALPDLHFKLKRFYGQDG